MSLTSWYNNSQFRLRLLTGFLWLVIYQTLDAALTSFLETLFRSSDGAPPWIWAFAVLSVILNMIAPLFISFWILTGAHSQLPWFKFESMIIESLRAWGSTFLWTLFLILPGIYKWFSYLLVPFIALFSKRYNSGEVDALEHSHRLFRKSWAKLIGLLLLFYVLSPFVVALLFDGYRKIWETPLMSLMVSTLDYALMILSLRMFIQVLVETMKEVNDEPVF